MIYHDFNLYIIDFYDSFTYNLLSDFKQMGISCKLIAFDDRTQIAELLNDQNRKLIVLGPGPGHPLDYMDSLDWCFDLIGKNPILGVCLGHQILCALHKQRIEKSRSIKHAQTSKLTYHDQVITAQRYNSLTVKPDVNFLYEHSCFFDDDHELAVVESKNWMSCQFHPESIGSMNTKIIYKNFLKRAAQ